MVEQTQLNPRDTAPTQSVQLVVVGATVYAAGRALLIDCTGTGALTYTLQDGSTITIHPQANTIYEFNDSVVQVASFAGSGNVYIKY